MSLLQTQRLRLRPCQIADWPALHALWTHPDVRRFLFDDRQITIDEARAFIADSQTSFTCHGYGIWLFFEPASNVIAGFTGLLHIPEAPPNLIFGTNPQHWNHGYATEATEAVLHHSFAVLRLNQIVADVDEPNIASIRVLDKLGLVFTHSAIVNGRPLCYYAIQSPPSP
jgi:[ribosomal protein S5]-alanine N-acetyltransferase